jgi:hypothetical protein
MRKETSRWLAAMAIVLISSSARADAEADATVAYGKGKKLFERGEYAAAVVAFKASLALLPSPNTELLLAHAEREQGHKVEAIEAYRRVVVESSARVRAGEARYRAALEEAGRWVAVLRTELGTIEATLRNAPEGTTVLVDGKAVDLPKGSDGAARIEIFHAPGRALVVARAPDGRESVRELTLLAGETKTALLDVGAPDAPAQAPVAAPEKSGFRGPPVPSWIAFGVGAAGGVMFAVFGSMAASKASELDACSPNCPASKRSVADSGKTSQVVANVSLATMGVGIATGAVLWIVLPRKGDKSEKAALGISPTGASLAGRF